jgi:hypothetical protein
MRSYTTQLRRGTERGDGGSRWSTGEYRGEAGKRGKKMNE